MQWVMYYINPSSWPSWGLLLGKKTHTKKKSIYHFCQCSHVQSGGKAHNNTEPLDKFWSSNICVSWDTAQMGHSSDGPDIISIHSFVLVPAF